MKTLQITTSYRLYIILQSNRHLLLDVNKQLTCASSTYPAEQAIDNKDSPSSVSFKLKFLLLPNKRFTVLTSLPVYALINVFEKFLEFQLIGFARQHYKKNKYMKIEEKIFKALLISSINNTYDLSRGHLILVRACLVSSMAWVAYLKYGDLSLAEIWWKFGSASAGSNKYFPHVSPCSGIISSSEISSSPSSSSSLPSSSLALSGSDSGMSSW